jgi:hypothetical protein
MIAIIEVNDSISATQVIEIDEPFEAWAYASLLQFHSGVEAEVVSIIEGKSIYGAAHRYDAERIGIELDCVPFDMDGIHVVAEEYTARLAFVGHPPKKSTRHFLPPESVSEYAKRWRDYMEHPTRRAPPWAGIRREGL